MGKIDLVRFESADALAEAAAREWLGALTRTKAQYAAFSGGRIAETFFDAIVNEVRQRNTSVAHLHFFQADERCVAPDNPESNYKLMRVRLLEPLNVAETQVHRIKGELGPEVAAGEASAEFARVVRPVLDFVFLGMGEDGHIASIFPGDPLKESPAEFYGPVFGAPKPPPERVTLAMHAMLVARNVCVLASGSGKAEALGKSLDPGGKTPLGKVLEGRDSTKVFTDIRRK